MLPIRYTTTNAGLGPLTFDAKIIGLFCFTKIKIHSASITHISMSCRGFWWLADLQIAYIRI